MNQGWGGKRISSLFYAGYTEDLRIFERKLARLAAVHVAGLEEKGGGGGDCFQQLWQNFTKLQCRKS